MDTGIPHNDLPRHIGIILDGNRRWAKEQGLPSIEGHKKGSENFSEVVRQLFDKGVEYVSAFVFSTENWRRTEEEVSYLMRLVVKLTNDSLDEFREAGIRMRILGSRDRLSKSVLKAVEKAESTTAHNTRGTLALCFNYGGHEEIIQAARSLVRNGVQPEDINEKTFEQSLYCSDIPALDMVVRTSGEQRLSGFMLYRAAYAELLFMEKYWPDVTPADMDSVLAEYATRQRRYGA